MAISGSFYGTTSNEFVRPKIEWSAVQSIEGNYSMVTATLSYSRTNSGYTTSGTWSGSITINGTQTSGSRSISVSQNSNTVAITATVRVNHASDGSKTIAISAFGSISGTSVSSTTISDNNIVLDTIGRATAPTLSASSVDMGNSVTITLSRASSSFTHRLWYKIGTDAWVWITGNIATSYTWTVPLNLANGAPASTSLPVQIICETYNGGTKIGTKSVELTANVPASVVPAISVSVTEATSGIAAQFSAFVQGKSTLAVAITATPAYSSPIQSYSTTIQGVRYTGASFTSEVLQSAGGAISVVVTDARGRSATYSANLGTLAYSPPVITTMAARRINTSGTDDDNGTRIAVNLDWSIAPVGNHNTRQAQLQYKRSGTDSWTTFDTVTNVYSYTGDRKFTSSPDLSTDYSYDVRLVLTDFFGSVSSDSDSPTGFTLMDFRSTGKGLGIGKVSEADALEVALESRFTGSVKVYGQADTSSAGEYGLLRLYNHDEDNTLSGYLTSASDGTGIKLQHYLNGVWKGFIKFLKNGNIAPGGVEMVDFIVDQATSNGFYYRKWNSGRLEMWYQYTANSVPISTSFGGMVRSDPLLFGQTAYQYPVAFVDEPNIQASYHTTSSDGAWFWPVPATSAATRKSYLCSGYLARPASATTSGYLEYYISGRWKA